MPAIPGETDRDQSDLGQKIDHKLHEMRRLLEADYIRLWRYVDSQKVIFGFRWFAGADEDLTLARAFGNYVGFRRQPLQPSGSFWPVSLTPTGEHPYWYFPELKELKPNTAGFVEAVLARSEAEHDLDGLICAGTSSSTWGRIQLDAARRAAIKDTLSDLHSLIRLYSLQRFHSAFIDAGEVRWSAQSSLLDFVQPPTPERILAILAENLDSKASFYLRNPSDLTLYAGIGSFYEQLKTFEDPDGANALADEAYRRSLISACVKPPATGEPKPVLFPGSPDLKTYEGIQTRFEMWVQAVTDLSKGQNLKLLGMSLGSEFQNIGRSGSFGVFAVWAHDVQINQALLCVASMERNFFRWETRIAIQDAVRWLSYNLPAARPLRNLLNRVSQRAGAQLRKRKDLQDELLPKAIVHSSDHMHQWRRSDRDSKNKASLKTVSAFVMSVDIRHSTQLMRDTLRPEEYAAFLTNLSRDLAEEVKDHYGVFDKFTGDGVLALFPTCMFAGDANATALWAIAAAERCHLSFDHLFETLRPYLAIVEAPQGLGIGIDFGELSLVDVGGELTIVGSPVVYACRLAAAPAGLTLLNEQAYQQISREHGCGDFEELVLPTKDRKMRARVMPRYWSQERALPTKFYWTE